MEESPVRIARRLIQSDDLIHQARRAAAIPEILPFSAVSDSKDLIANSHRTALLDTQRSRPVEAGPQHIDAEAAVFGSRAVIQLVE